MKLRKRWNHKKYVICFMFIIFLTMSIGFAYIQSSFGFSGNTTIVKGAWDVHLENLVIAEGSVEEDSPATISDDKKSISFSPRFTGEQEYYQFEVDIVNNGQIDAMVSDIELLGLSDAIKPLMDFQITYDNDAKINVNDSLKSNTTEKIKLFLKVKDNIELSELPAESWGLYENLTLNISYVQADSNVRNKDEGPKAHILGKELLALKDDVEAPSNQTLFLKSDTINDEHPIFYFKGNHSNTNNNVLFANKCWKIVRTTETGGIKLLYNGLPNDSKCELAGESQKDVYIPTQRTGAFNSNYLNPVYVGYMYSASAMNYQQRSKNMSLSTYAYGNYISYSGGVYTLQSTKQIPWGGEVLGHHYTCFSTGNTCSEVNYIYYVNGTTAYYITLSGGKTIESVINEELFPNSNARNAIDSTIKGYIDTWFAGTDGMMSYLDYLEDTVYCNDRSILSLGGWNPNGGKVNTTLNFASFDRTSRSSITLGCKNKYDRFTLKASQPNNNPELDGNQMLDYPVGLLTQDEMNLVGLSSSSYLYNYQEAFWSISPYYFGVTGAIIRDANNGNLNYLEVNKTGAGIRPVVSLRSSVVAGSGDGSMSSPYIIE